MTSIKWWRVLIVLFALSLTPLTLFAGGPLVVGGPTLGVEGEPFVWDNSKAIGYRVDGGPLGSVSNATAISMVATAFSRWSSISTASLSFTSLGSIQGISGGNVKSLSQFDTAYASCQAATQSPIIFDDDGSLLLALTGDTGVVGLTGPCSITSDGHIRSAFSIIGNPPALTTSQLQAVMVHEFGHFAGLDHTDIRVPLSSGTTVEDIDNTPTMYFALVTDKQANPKVDDQAWISKLYPSSSYQSSYGMIRGDVYFSDGQFAVQDYLIVARKTDDQHKTAASSISGYRFTGNPGQPYTADYLPCTPASACPPNGTYGYNVGGSSFGSRDATLRGTFEIPLPPGEYLIEMQGGAGGQIGPINPVLIPPGKIGYWPTDSYSGSKTVTVTAGETVDGIQVVIAGTPSSFDTFDHPETTGGTAKAAQPGAKSSAVSNGVAQ